MFLYNYCFPTSTSTPTPTINPPHTPTYNKNEFLQEFKDFTAQPKNNAPKKESEGMLQRLFKKAALPAAFYSMDQIKKLRDDVATTVSQYNGPLRFEKIQIKIDGIKIDGVKIINPKAVEGRWMAKCLGNSELYESRLTNLEALAKEADQFKSNIILFNYPGVGLSEGLASPDNMVKSYKGVLAYLEGPNVSAKEIIGHGFSIGGGVQGEALKTYTFKPETKTCFIQDRTFSQASKVASSCFWYGNKRPIGWLASYLVESGNWNFNAVPPEKFRNKTIVVQNGNQYPLLWGAPYSKPANDGVIRAKASLAHYFTKKNKSNISNIPFLFIYRPNYTQKYGAEHNLPFSELIEQSIQGKSNSLSIPTVCLSILAKETETLNGYKQFLNKKIYG